MKRGSSWASFLALACITGCGGAPVPTGHASQAIINGQTDDSDASVVLLLAQVPGSMNASLCTASVISPHVVLTAAHCVSPDTVGAGAKFVVYAGTTLDMSSQSSDFLPVTETHYDTAFNPKAPDDGHDIGVAVLKNPTTLTPLLYNRTPITPAMAGQAARLVGYGLADPNDAKGMTAGTRRQAPSKLLQINPGNAALVDFEDNLHTICEGDSGGPAFMTIDGQERIVGVTSYGYEGCPTNLPGTETRVDLYTSFIDPYVTQLDPPAVPEGGACASDADCAPRRCVATSAGKVCSDGCDPAASTCSDGTQCTDVDGQFLCVQPMATKPMNGGAGHSGCDFGAGAPGGGAALLLVAVALALALGRRRLSN